MSNTCQFVLDRHSGKQQRQIPAFPGSRDRPGGAPGHDERQLHWCHLSHQGCAATLYGTEEGPFRGHQQYCREDRCSEMHGRTSCLII